MVAIRQDPGPAIHTMNFPNKIRTKAEAKRLAAEIFPSASIALAALLAEKPDCLWPRQYLRHPTSDMLRAVFAWLLARDTQVYKRAQFGLFYSLAERLIDQVDANACAKTHEIYTESRDREARGRLTAGRMGGDGEGI